MPKIPKIDEVSFLVNRKFNKLRTQNINKNLTKSYSDPDYAGFDHNLRFALSKDRLTEAEAYRAKLLTMDKAEIAELYRLELHNKNLEDDQARFFHSKIAEADFDYWSKMSHWTLEEAVALSFGKNPEVVSTKTLSSIPSYLSPFIQEYQKLMKLAVRAIAWQKLYDPVLPSIYVNWVLHNEISFPNQLRELVKDRLGGVVHWQKAYKNLLDEYQSLLAVNSVKLESKDTFPDSIERLLVGLKSSEIYIPPYVEFLLEATKSLKLSPDKKLNKSQITNWLDSNWPSNLDGKSVSLIQTMATILRRPEDKKGGNTPW